jgi:MinD-like ATPase involved in chromosome partitioning or flagellar assembly
VTGLHRRGPSEAPEELSTLALAHTHGKIVGVVSRAGGVGKTAVAAAVGIICGEAVHDSGGSAAVIDQNVDNPDQWGRLELDGRVRTVAEIMADIEGGREWSIPAWNRTPGLAIYPERRTGGGGYAPGLIEHLAGQLRNLHLISVVDLPNCLPDFTSPKGALSAGWLSMADLVTIPTTDDPTRLRGVIELLDTPVVRGDARNGYRSIPVIVAYVRSPLRAIREDRNVRRTLEEIRDRVVEVVEIPKDERATLAVVRGQPITEINPVLRRAYIELSLAIARALAEA